MLSWPWYKSSHAWRFSSVGFPIYLVVWFPKPESKTRVLYRTRCCTGADQTKSIPDLLLWGIMGTKYSRSRWGSNSSSCSARTWESWRGGGWGRECPLQPIARWSLPGIACAVPHGPPMVRIHHYHSESASVLRPSQLTACCSDYLHRTWSTRLNRGPKSSGDYRGIEWKEELGKSKLPEVRLPGQAPHPLQMFRAIPSSGPSHATTTPSVPTPILLRSTGYKRKPWLPLMSRLLSCGYPRCIHCFGAF